MYVAGSGKGRLCAGRIIRRIRWVFGALVVCGEIYFLLVDSDENCCGSVSLVLVDNTAKVCFLFFFVFIERKDRYTSVQVID